MGTPLSTEGEKKKQLHVVGARIWIQFLILQSTDMKS